MLKESEVVKMSEINSDKILREANEIGQMLKDRYNIQPATDSNGVILPPPTVFDMTLKEMGKGAMIN